MAKVKVLWLFFIGVVFCHGQKDEKPVTKSDVEIIFLNVVSTVQARFATTLITSQVANRADSAKEITFTAQLPDAAFISNFSMLIGETIVYGNVEEKEKAKADFDAAKARGESTGLVAKKPRETNAFTISVNVAAQSKVRFNLTYQEILKRVHGVYKQIINLQPEQPVSELKVDVYITERGEIKNVKVPKFGEKMGEKTNKELLAAEDEPNVEIKTILKENNTNSIRIRYQPKQKTKEEVYNGQLVVLYDVKRDESAGDIEVVNGYFVHFFAPDGLKKQAKDIVFVLDKSGSMQGRKMTQLKDAMKVILKDLNEDDTFQIIFFSDRTELWRKESSTATSENVQAAVTYVQDTEADGGTNIYDALQEALQALKKSSSTKVPMILFLTDGEPTVGKTNRDEIVNDTTKSNDQERKIIIHGIAFGDGSDYNILQKISGRNRGLARRVYEDSDAAIQLAGFYEEISSPILTNLKIDYMNETVDVNSVVQDNSHNYYDGSEVVVVGKLREDKSLRDDVPIDAKVSGQGASGAVAIQSRSTAPIVCREPWPIIYYYDDDVIAGPRAPPSTVIYRPPIWCCPPPHCCWWRSCPPPPPPPPPKEPLPATSAGGFIERMWAYQTIKKMLKDADLKDGKDEKESAKKKALELSLKYHFVTELTSMVVVKPNETKSTTLEEDKDKPRPVDAAPGAALGGFAQSASGFGGRGGGGALTLTGARPGPMGPPPAPAPNQGVFPPPPPPPPPPPSPTKDTDDKEEGEANKPQPTTSTPQGCTVEVILIKDPTNLTSTIDKNRGDLATATLARIGSYNQVFKSKVAVVEALPSGKGSVILNKTDIPYNPAQSSPSQSALTYDLSQILDSQFEQYASKNVQRNVVFFISNSDVQYALDASKALKSHGVAVYAVSFLDDRSAGFTQKMNSIATDPGKVYYAPPTTGEQLGQAMAYC